VQGGTRRVAPTTAPDPRGVRAPRTSAVDPRLDPRNQSRGPAVDPRLSAPRTAVDPRGAAPAPRR